MKNNQLKTKLVREAVRQGHNLKHASPTILIVAGTLSVIGGTVLFMKKTKRYDQIVTKLEDTNYEIKRAAKEEPDYVASGLQRKDTVHAYTSATLEVIKAYAPSVLLVTAGVSAIFGSHRILQKRNVALVGAYKTLDAGFKKYRSRVVNELGVEKDREFMYDRVTNKETVEKVDKKGNVTTEEVDTESIEVDEDETYGRVFGPGNPNWDGSNPTSNFLFVKQVEHYLRHKLYADGILFLNDVYKQLGLKTTPVGQVTGWTVPNDGMAEFDLGYTIDSGSDLPYPMDRQMTQGIWLDIVPEGIVIGKI